MVSGFYQEIDGYKNYMNLREENLALSNENSTLRNQVLKYQSQLMGYHSDSISGVQKANIQASMPVYGIIGARVISNSISNIRNYMIIDKGSKDGVTKDMGVINDKGPVGVVIDVSDHYCSVMSLINKDAIISAKVKATQHIGQLKWSGHDIRIAELDEIPNHIKLKKGDEIVTSGYSTYFPEGIRIGRVLQQKDDAGNFASIKVQLYNDFSNIGYVCLVSNRKQQEIQAVENSIKELQAEGKNEK